MVKVDGEEIIAGTNAIIECKKHLTDIGSINLTVKVSTEDGRTIEFLLHNYSGADTYVIGNRSPEYSFINGNWMKYSETLPPGVWSTTQNKVLSDGAILEITNDNGTLVKGVFSFDAQAEVEESIRSVSEGNFSVGIDR